MKKIISFIGPFIFLATILIGMNSFKHVNTLNIVEETIIEEHLSKFEEKKKLETELAEQIISSINKQTWDEQ
ncbi:hypothetical protein [Halalkalibacter alkalisediminis]|uniref:Secreted protein n=1 Tax=Halalkalibacter alkalisediminis TaxID=935616 RepID=A0ABV6NK45_9BACI|nr:hypothetical protein [Halalkalibacter alkalisediminis]